MPSSTSPLLVSLDFDPTPDGTYRFTASARDRAIIDNVAGMGNAATGTISLIVDNPGPMVTFIAPILGESYGGFVDIEADVSDFNNVDQVVLRREGILLATLTQPPWRVRLDTRLLTEGPHAIEAVSRDGQGNISTSTQTLIIDNIGPIITFSEPVAASQVSQTVTVTANAVPNSTNRIPNVRMKTQDNKDVLFYDDLIKNKVVVINLMYTNCETCEKGTKNLVQLQKALGDHLGRDVFIYSISLDPQTDTPEVLKGYATKYGAKPGWTFLTGKDEDVDAIRQSLGLTMLSQELRAKIGLPERKLNQDADQKLHTGMIAIGNDTFKRWSKTSALSRPDQILQIIERMKPPSQPKK